MMIIPQGSKGTESMARPREEQPTVAELELLKILWDREGPASVREVVEEVNRNSEPPRAYTSVMSLLAVMTEKGLLRRKVRGRAFLYEPASTREKTLGAMLDHTLQRLFDGSASLLVAHLLDQSTPTPDELDEIRNLINAHQSRQSNTSTNREV